MSVAESVDRQLTLKMWKLDESLGRPHGGVHLTTEAINLIFDNIILEYNMQNRVEPKLDHSKPLTTQANATQQPNATQSNRVSSWLKTNAQKLKNIWQKAGSPTDSNQVAKLMVDQGVPPEAVNSAINSVGISTAQAQPQAQAQAQDQAQPQAQAQDQAQPQQANLASNIFSDPEKLVASFEEFMTGGGKTTKLRPIIKSILMNMGSTTVSENMIYDFDSILDIILESSGFDMYMFESTNSKSRVVISEQSAGEFAKEYFASKTTGMKIPTNYSNKLEEIYKEFTNEYKASKKFPEEASKKIQKMVNAVNAIQQRKSDGWGGTTSNSDSSSDTTGGQAVAVTPDSTAQDIAKAVTADYRANSSNKKKATIAAMTTIAKTVDPTELPAVLAALKKQVDVMGKQQTAPAAPAAPAQPTA